MVLRRNSATLPLWPGAQKYSKSKSHLLIRYTIKCHIISYIRHVFISNPFKCSLCIYTLRILLETNEKYNILESNNLWYQCTILDLIIMPTWTNKVTFVKQRWTNTHETVVTKINFNYSVVDGKIIVRKRIFNQDPKTSCIIDWGYRLQLGAIIYVNIVRQKYPTCSNGFIVLSAT